MAVQISSATLLGSDDLITHAYLDYPRAGPVDGYVFDAYGWVIGKEPVTEVEFVHEGVVIACCDLNVQRPDVARAFGGSARVGFWKAIGTVGLAPTFTIRVRAVLQDGRQREIAEIRGTQQLTSAFTSTMQPITVISPGRSGSSLLMRMLAEHPDVVVHERFPYEQRVCSYWMHFVQVLAMPVDTSRAESFEFWTNRRQLPPFPSFFLDPVLFEDSVGAAVDRWYASNQVEEFARVAQAAVESFYRRYARRRKSTAPAFFAEKFAPADHIRSIIRQLYPRTREIFLVREPRDTLASVRAFDNKRGFGEFAGQLAETDEQLVDLIRRSILDLTRLWKSRSRYGALLRYEELIRSPAEPIHAMLEALDLDSSPSIVDAMAKAADEITTDVNAHRTSPDVASSIGRWQRDLEPRVQKMCDEAFGGLLDELGGNSFPTGMSENRRI
ncbi:sulfotransferase [[Mycobacterium] zoologicum]|uniref:sulfotransferase n=1 Tax=[Mycobacterium] zoologicum TaxID=2872311 RepID=UPI002B9D464D|nr:sulfotransferase [Mycolicibacter sp. MYC101]MEB3065663.1 sulfotransferase [Mycolicibacter sp. MYC101]